MNLSSSDLNNLTELAIKAAKKAGELISSYVDKDITVNNKEAADSLASQVVTEVDVKAQDIILEILDPTLSEYDLALLTEESIDDKSRFGKDYFWCIDPMDGTLAFTEKTPGYAVSISLVSQKGESMVGVVFDPVTQTLYHAVNGKGAFKNDQAWQPDLAKFESPVFTLYIDRSFETHTHFQLVMEDIKTLIFQLGYKKLQVEKAAGAVLNACWVIDRTPGCYFKIPKPQTGGGSLWDFAATACIAKEVGSYGKSIDGSPLDLNRPDSTFMNHKGALYASNDTIAQAFKELLLKYC